MLYLHYLRSYVRVERVSLTVKQIFSACARYHYELLISHIGDTVADIGSRSKANVLALTSVCAAFA